MFVSHLPIALNIRVIAVDCIAARDAYAHVNEYPLECEGCAGRNCPSPWNDSDPLTIYADFIALSNLCLTWYVFIWYKSGETVKNSFKMTQRIEELYDSGLGSRSNC